MLASCMRRFVTSGCNLNTKDNQTMTASQSQGTSTAQLLFPDAKTQTTKSKACARTHVSYGKSAVQLKTSLIAKPQLMIWHAQAQLSANSCRPS